MKPAYFAVLTLLLALGCPTTSTAGEGEGEGAGEGEGEGAAEGEGEGAAEGEGGEGEGAAEGEGGEGEGEGGEGEGGEGEGEGAVDGACSVAGDDVILLRSSSAQLVNAVCGALNACNAIATCDANHKCDTSNRCICDHPEQCARTCNADGSCPGADVCDPRTSLCFVDAFMCLTNASCGADACRKGPCPDCKSCVVRGTGAIGGGCTTDADCASASCVTGVCLQECERTGDCPAGQQCTNAVCVLPGALGCTATCDVDSVCSGSTCSSRTCTVESDCAGNDCSYDLSVASCRAIPAVCGAAELHYKIFGGATPEFCVREDRRCFTNADCADLGMACVANLNQDIMEFYEGIATDDGRTGLCARAL